MLNYLQELKEEIDIQAIEKFTYKQITLIVCSKTLKKYECYKLYFLYCGLSILYMLKKLDKFLLKKQSQKFLQNIVKIDESIHIKNSPYLVHSNNLQLMDLYFWVICCHYIYKDYLNIHKNSILQKLKDIKNFEDLRDIYCYCFLKKYFKNEITNEQKNMIYKIVQNSRNYDGGYGFKQHDESHGAGLYSAIKIYKYINKLNEIDQKTILWCSNRQKEYGIEGRVNKSKEDSCYTFWIGIIFYELKITNYINKNQLKLFLLFCQDKLGGIKKNPWEDQADIIHTYQGLLGGLIFQIIDLQQPLELIIQQIIL